MLIFCRRMCHHLLLASNCFLSTSFFQTGLSISPRCYCDLLVYCTNHFLLRVFCAVVLKCHTGNVSTFQCDCTKGDWFCSTSSSNSEPNLLQLVGLKRDCKGDQLLFVSLLFHQQSSIIVITLNIFGTGTLSSILVELHKMIRMLHAPDSYFFPNMPC